jgi:hypothetical protein
MEKEAKSLLRLDICKGLQKWWDDSSAWACFPINITKPSKCHVRFGALEEVFMSYRPHGAWRTMEVLEELA